MNPIQLSKLTYYTKATDVIKKKTANAYSIYEMTCSITSSNALISTFDRWARFDVTVDSQQLYLLYAYIHSTTDVANVNNQTIPQIMKVIDHN